MEQLALELALRCLGIRPGEHVITSSRTFVATASCIALLGAIPIFADVDRDTQNIIIETIRAVFTSETRARYHCHSSRRQSMRHGLARSICPRAESASDRRLRASPRATYKGRLVGSLGDAAAFSFCNDKIISSRGEGGMLTTNSFEVWERASAFRDHGTNPGASAQPANGNGFRWIHDSLGTNWRLSEAHAAVGRAQLRRPSSWVDRRRALARTLNARLGTISALRVPAMQSHIEPAYYRFYAFVRPERLRPGWNRDAILHAIDKEGVPCFSGSCSEVYMEKAFAPWRPDFRRPTAQEFGETSLAFPVHPTLSDIDIGDICPAVEKVMACASQSAKSPSTSKALQLDFCPGNNAMSSNWEAPVKPNPRSY